jgi:integrase
VLSGEFDLEKAVWEIPAERMKMKRPHLVPLYPSAGDRTAAQSDVWAISSCVSWKE